LGHRRSGRHRTPHPAGAPPAHFERFFCADGARSRGSGAGLGLAISRWIADAHGGEIRVESGPGGEISFCVRLPGAKSVATAAS
jgi:signal transduction histidine kinase